MSEVYEALIDYCCLDIPNYIQIGTLHLLQLGLIKSDWMIQENPSNCFREVTQKPTSSTSKASAAGR